MNFSFLSEIPEYEMFAGACVDAEQTFASSSAMCVLATRRAMELAVKWVYAADSTMKEPWRDNLASLIHEPSFKDSMDNVTWGQLRFIWKLGNEAAHTGRRITPQDAVVALRGLFNFVQWIDYCYGADFKERKFCPERIPALKRAIDEKKYRQALKESAEKDARIAELEEQIKKKREQFAAVKQERPKEEGFNPDEIPEYETRRRYIDVDLEYAGWVLGDSVLAEVEVLGMPNDSGLGYVDYVLNGRNGKPLAIIEAKRTMYDPKKGQRQAELYADCLEVKYGYRPFIFLSNGFETYFAGDENAPMRRCSGVFSRDDLQRLMNRRGHVVPLTQMKVNEDICGGNGRYYQIAAVKAVCQHMEEGHRRSLVVMATGTGKTRTAAGLIDLLVRAGAVTNALFLADRLALVKQAKNAFQKNMPSTTMCNLCDKNDRRYAEDSRIVFSTYPTILNAIDEVKGKDGSRLYSPAHFDFIVVDEAHRSIFKKYREIFDYFDAPILGLTATPKDEVDRNTYDFFDVERGIPTYLYEYDTAVHKDHVLVPYYNIETRTTFLSEGITYDDLSDEDRQRYDDDWEEAQGTAAPDFTPSQEVNRFVFNEKTIDQVLTTLMDEGIKVKGGTELGKTVIFAQNRKHADLIVERFGKLYPKLSALGYCKRVVYTDDYASDIITDFETKDMPVITVSVDMMDTGIDVPEILNLVFFKQVRSKVKFWQMIGRGTRLCPGIGVLEKSGAHDDKDCFYVFDWCMNFEFFRTHKDIAEGKAPESVPEKIFKRQALIVQALQNAEYADDGYQALRTEIVGQMVSRVQEIREPLTTAAKLHLREVDKFSQLQSYQCLTDEDVVGLNEIAPLVRIEARDEHALRFDSLMYGFIAAALIGSKTDAFRSSVVGVAVRLQHKATVPQVKEKLPFISRVCSEGYLEGANALMLEEVRLELRDLAKFLKDEARGRKVVTSIVDPVISQTEGSVLEPEEDYEDYKLKVERYIETNGDKTVIAKLHRNIPMTTYEFVELGNIFTHELGNETDYENAYGDIPFGRLVRKIAGVDHEAAMEAFSEFLNDTTLNRQQMDFVTNVVSYVEENGYIDLAKINEAPFDRPAKLIRLFDRSKQQRLVKIIRSVNDNATTPAA
jgi:type I restriction enzyme R subunit